MLNTLPLGTQVFDGKRKEVLCMRACTPSTRKPCFRVCASFAVCQTKSVFDTSGKQTQRENMESYMELISACFRSENSEEAMR